MIAWRISRGGLRVIIYPWRKERELIFVIRPWVADGPRHPSSWCIMLQFAVDLNGRLIAILIILRGSKKTDASKVAIERNSLVPAKLHDYVRQVAIKAQRSKGD